jgi:hypothetical protein
VLAAPHALSQGLGIESKGLGPGQFDRIVGHAFACRNQHGKKLAEKFGRPPLPCLAESALLRHLEDEHAAGTDIVAYLQDRRGVCGSAGRGKACRVVREVSQRSYSGNNVQFSMRTTFTVDIEITPDGEPTRVTIDRYDLFGSEQDL